MKWYVFYSFSSPYASSNLASARMSCVFPSATIVRGNNSSTSFMSCVETNIVNRLPICTMTRHYKGCPRALQKEVSWASQIPTLLGQVERLHQEDRHLGARHQSLRTIIPCSTPTCDPLQRQSLDPPIRPIPHHYIPKDPRRTRRDIA